MRIASFNIRKAVGLDWQRNPDRIVDVLEEINADVVVLQEADKRFLTRAGVLPLSRLANEQNYNLADVALYPSSHGWHGNAILYRTSMKIEKTTRIELPFIEPRGAVSATFSVPCIEVIGVHLGLTRGIRAKQLATLEQYVSGQPHPVVIAGDFNEWRKELKNFGSDGEMIAPGPSFHVSKPKVAFDRFFIQSALRATASHVHISALSQQASDHYPVVVDFEFLEQHS